MSFDLAALREAVAAQGVVARVVVVAHAGSVPRESGTAMLVWAAGQSGTIGGGALEFEAAAAARDLLGRSGAMVSRLPLGPALNQCCGGAVTLATEIFDKTTLPQLDAPCFARRIEGASAKPLAITRAEARMRNGQGSALIFADGWLCETMEAAQTPLWIYGAGHVGRAIVRVMAPLPDVAITWVDTAADRFPDDVPPGVTALPAPTPAASVTLAPAGAYHLVLTYSHALDLELCHQLLTHGFGFAGLIGSETKWARFRTRLRALGHAPADISRICCPIGDPALGKHPQAIALGVASQLVMRSAEARDMGERDTA